MIWIILTVLLGPAAILLAFGWSERFGRLIRKLEIQQPPAWIRHVMGLKFSPTKAVLFAWIYGPCLPVWALIVRVRSWLCRHSFDKTYGTNRQGDPDFYCSKCYRWKDHNGFCE